MKTPHITVAHFDDGIRVTDYPSKTAAYRAGMALRRAGVDAYSYSVADAAQFGLDPRAKPTGTVRAD